MDYFDRHSGNRMEEEEVAETKTSQAQEQDNYVIQQNLCYDEKELENNIQSQYKFIHYQVQKKYFICKYCFRYQDGVSNFFIPLQNFSIQINNNPSQIYYHFNEKNEDIIQSHQNLDIHIIHESFNKGKSLSFPYKDWLDNMEFQKSNFYPNLQIQFIQPQRFLSQWFDIPQAQEYLAYDKYTEEMFCTLCIKRGKSNVFTTGCNKLKNDNITYHFNSKQHKQALEDENQQEKLKLGLLKDEDTQKEEMSPTYLRYFYQLKNAYFVLSESLAFVKYINLTKSSHESINLILKSLNQPIHDLHYCTNYGFQLYINCMYDYFKNKINNSLLDFQYVSTMSDSTKGINGKNYMIHYLRKINLKNSCIENVFLSCYPTSDTCSQTIHQEEERIREKFQIPLYSVAMKGSDLTNSYFGKLSGSHKLQKDINPFLISVECASHNFELGYKDSIEEVQELTNFKLLIRDIVVYIKASYNREKQFMKTLNEVDQLELKLIQEPQTRWGYLYRVSKRIFLVKNSLYEYFEETKDTSDQVTYIKQRMKKTSFLAILSFMQDLLPELDLISKESQNVQANPIEFYTNLEQNLNNIEEIIDLIQRINNYPYHTQQYIDTISNQAIKYQLIVDTNSRQLKELFLKIGNSFVDNIKERFQDKFLRYFSIFDISRLKTLINSNYLQFESQKLKKIWEHFCQNKTNAQGQVVDALIDCSFENLQSQLINCIKIIKASYQFSIESSYVWIQLYNYGQKNKQSYIQEITTIVLISLIAPLSNSESERGFSQHKYILNNYRTHLDDESLQKAMFIALNCKKVEQDDLLKCYKIWKDHYQKQWHK